MARILGLDVGERRIGVAISDPDGRIAVPLRIIERRDDAADMQEIAKLAALERVTALVAGFPRSLDGSIGEQARRVESFAKRAAEAAGLPLELWDERLSTVQAERPVAGAKRRKRARRGPADDVAAAIILQSYLDRQRAGTQP